MYKVIHLITGLSTGGAERALCNVLQGGVSKDFDNLVVSLTDEGTVGASIRALGVPVATLGMQRGRPSISSVFKLRNIIYKFQPDLIQGWMYHGNLVSTFASKMARKQTKVVWNIRHSVYNMKDEKPSTRFIIYLNRLFSTVPDTILYNSQTSRQQHEALGFSKYKGKVLPNGFDLKLFSYSHNTRSRMREGLGIPANSFVVGHVARFHPMKNHMSFLKVTTSLVSRYPGLYVVLCGRDVVIENRELSSLIPVSLRNRFRLLGERNDIPGVMSVMDIFCQSSWSEAFPNVLGEAMASSLPCVATDVGDSASIVGDSGIIVPPRDEAALEAGIEKLLLASDEERSFLKVRAKEKIHKCYALNNVVVGYKSLYRDLL
ncbi:glycosyltransferase [Exilibacterium tricleocarpae]|uniref:Glycosyltransferase n=1 Tax=Exilibacterium tricleocarpae TaxID=2591008 RepID=A0A545U436_9GAMM|nr:glycosyltransferase [Exilibacterium tricleocarpae]TQV84232.1 glycosyltransferase [Exilibacterium tricleocarpae]